MALDVAKQLGAGAAIAEATRGKGRLEGFMPDLFRGKLRLDLLFEWQSKNQKPNPIAEALSEKLKSYLVENVDPEEIERTNEIPASAINWFCQNGYFGLKIPEEYGGFGLKQSEYQQILQLAATWSGALVALLSASNTIGAGWPITAYGSEEQKKKWLPKVSSCPSGFAFTEEKAGSDPSAMETVAVRQRNRFAGVEGYKIIGRKWWTTNGPMSDTRYISPVIILIAKIVDDPAELKEPGYEAKFGAFIVPTNAAGVRIVQRCDFAGLNGIYNGITDFENLYVSRSEMIGKEGDGFRIAFEALNNGRIALAAACVAMAKNMVGVGKWWGNKRFQWGKLIGQHEDVGSGILVKNLADTLTLEAMVWFASMQADDHRDCRMEAATTKVLASERAFQIADDLLQLRGGRGYETADSLKKRGEAPIPVERWWRDARINRIFEGESGFLLRMFVVREGISDYKERGEVFLEPGKKWEKFRAAMGFAADLAALTIPKSSKGQLENVLPDLRRQLRFVEKNGRRLARAIILASGKYRNKLIHKQLTFKRFFNIAAELYAMATVCSYTGWLVMTRDNPEFAAHNVFLAKYYCEQAKERIRQEFRSLKTNSDARARVISKKLLEGRYDDWLREGTIPTTSILNLDGIPKEVDTDCNHPQVRH